jgi:hypothetical protein
LIEGPGGDSWPLRSIMDITNNSHIELFPGFILVEKTPGYTIIKVPSDFTLKIKRMGPFMFDVMNDQDLKDPGPFMITVKLLEKTRPQDNIEQTILYQPPKDDDGNIVEPDRYNPDMERAWMYYKQWQLHEHKRRELVVTRGSKRLDFALRNCIEVLDGYVDINDEVWVEPIRDMIGDFLSVGDRLVTFLKTQVVRTQVCWDVVNFLLKVEEVTIEGLKQAFDSFLGRVEWGKVVDAIGEVARVGSEI